MLLIQAKTEWGGRTQRYIIANSLEANLPVAVKKTENYRFFFNRLRLMTTFRQVCSGESGNTDLCTRRRWKAKHMLTGWGNLTGNQKALNVTVKTDFCLL